MTSPGTVNSNFNEIPTIDLGKSLTDNPGKLAVELREIRHRVGFFVVTNHGIPTEAVNDTFKLGRELFALPLEKKQLNRQTPIPLFQRLGS